jgi:hypothetical protein
MRFLRFLLLLAFAAVLAGAIPARAESAKWYDFVFTETLSIQDQTAAGFAKLTDDEQALLNASVAREVSLARAGNVRGFAGTYIGRRTADERARIGLDRLSPDEQARLNSLVAAAIAGGPVSPASASFLGKDALSVVNRLQIHGEVSLTVGSSGHGRNFYGTSFSTTITDPETGLTIGLGYDQFHGSGRYGSGRYGSGWYDPGWYGYDDGDYVFSDLGYSNLGFSGRYRGLEAGFVRQH